MKLPEAEHAIISERKVVEYLLNEWHPVGCSKAIYFQAFGFHSTDWEEFAQSLRLHAVRENVVRTSVSDYGVVYRVEGPLETPDGRSPWVCSVWIIENPGDFPQLITAYPG